ncbi:hypothetical protein RHMOL_Rhmol08G0165700 [Rhododendron molle]|uniref:Uncharacterized protein n=1 Tax=Rhododendron molle TaxID=49168 RepID=A0ACC0MQL7_RHOML|nr:hypothetical protein RHMOL_Rhmol08G0165700 [Rhododendron molle]
MMGHSTVRLLLCGYAGNNRYIFGPSLRNLSQTKNRSLHIQSTRILQTRTGTYRARSICI